MLTEPRRGLSESRFGRGTDFESRIGDVAPTTTFRPARQEQRTFRRKGRVER